MCEVKREYYKTGELESECFELNEKKEGIYKSYYPDGQLEIICSYIDGKINGEHKYYHINGQLCEICFYTDDKMNGEYRRYDPLKRLLKTLMFENGVLSNVNYKKIVSCEEYENIN